MSPYHLLPLLLLAAPAAAADPVTIVLPDRAVCGAAVVTVGHVGTVTGPAEWKRAVAAIDLSDMPVRETSVTVTRRQVEVRLKLAGLRDTDFRVLGSDRVIVVADRKAVPVEDVVIAAKAAILSRLPYPPDEVTLDLVRPVVTKLPEVGTAERVDIRAEPNTNSVQMGRQQVNVTISTRGEKRLTLSVFLEAKLAGQAAAAAATPRTVAGPVAKVAPAVTPGQKVKMSVTIGELRVTAMGLSLEEGKVGQMIRVRNVDSNKVLSARVSGPGTVEVE
jgi:flagella basal body P-ring formation protein FlgA